METNTLRKSYKNHIENLEDINLFEYLEIGFKLNEESILKSIKYFKSCMPKELKEILLKKSYWNLYYNKPMEDILKENLKLCNENHIKIISTFVYSFQTDKRDFEKLEDEEKLNKQLLEKGFKMQEVLNKDGWINNLKDLDGLKVICIFDRDKIGLMGSFTEKQEKEGKLIYIKDKGYLAFLPKRHTKTGQILRDKFYYKLN